MEHEGIHSWSSIVINSHCHRRVIWWKFLDQQLLRKGTRIIKARNDFHSVVKNNDWLWANLPIYFWAISSTLTIWCKSLGCSSTVKLETQEKRCYCPSHWMVLHWQSIVCLNYWSVSYFATNNQLIHGQTSRFFSIASSNHANNVSPSRFSLQTTATRLTTRLWKISLPLWSNCAR